MTRSGWAQLRHLAEDDLHLFSTGQARDAGISRTELTAAVERQELWQAAPDVWAFTDLEMNPYEGWAAAWMTMNLQTPIEERHRNPDVVISHDAAAVIRELGTLAPRALTVTAPITPGQVPASVSAVIVEIGDVGIEGVDWTICEGLPVSTPKRLIADLAAVHTEGSHLGTVIEEAIVDNLLTHDEATEILRPHIHRWGLTNPDTAVDLLINASVEPEYPNVPR
ncbi:type IV toxin-antitoxin system AbiEi family antitoxin domain-containing protein [Gordonia aichiensis]|uniref:type IV toxin-antitoxin system AbiEi family antitoxin domain-containing protein n=1 Tax=Gordonia aichiensis TaxID=36820 RepID=UPI003264912B